MLRSECVLPRHLEFLKVRFHMSLRRMNDNRLNKLRLLTMVKPPLPKDFLWAARCCTPKLKAAGIKTVKAPRYPACQIAAHGVHEITQNVVAGKYYPEPRGGGFYVYYKEIHPSFRRNGFKCFRTSIALTYSRMAMNPSQTRPV